MARKNVFTFAMFDGADLSGDLISPITNTINMDKASIHVSWNGTAPVGEFSIEARNSATDSWYSLDFGNPIAVATDSGNHQLLLNELPFYEIRLNYYATSGTGTVDAVLVAKQVGG